MYSDVTNIPGMYLHIPACNTLSCDTCLAKMQRPKPSNSCSVCSDFDVSNRWLQEMEYYTQFIDVVSGGEQDGRMLRVNNSHATNDGFRAEQGSLERKEKEVLHHAHLLAWT